MLKNEAAMFEKIEKLGEAVNQEFDASFSVAKDSLLEELAVILRFLEEQRLALGIQFVSGKGKQHLHPGSSSKKVGAKGRNLR